MTANQCIFDARGEAVDYTPGTDVAAGEVVVLGNALCGIANGAIPSGELGALCIEGIVDAVKVQNKILRGDQIFWDADADPYNGSAGTGAATNQRSAGDVLMGVAVEDAASSTERVKVKLQPNDKRTGQT